MMPNSAFLIISVAALTATGCAAQSETLASPSQNCGEISWPQSGGFGSTSLMLTTDRANNTLLWICSDLKMCDVAVRVPDASSVAAGWDASGVAVVVTTSRDAQQFPPPQNLRKPWPVVELVSLPSARTGESGLAAKLPRPLVSSLELGSAVCRSIPTFRAPSP